MRPRAPLFLLLVLALASGCRGQCKQQGAPQGQSLGFMAQYAADVCLQVAGGQGIAVGLSRDDGVLGFGSAGTAGGSEIATDSTAFRLGTLSEVYTATLVARLADRGSLSLDDRVTDTLPWFVAEDPISVRQLLTHRSGLRDVTKIGAVDLAVAEGPAALVRIALDKGLQFEPGARFSESPTDYLVLGLIVEAELARTYGEALHEHVLDPFGLAATYVEAEDGVPSDLAAGHKRSGAIQDDAFAVENGGGAWGIVTNTLDLDRFLRILFEQDGFLEDVTRLELTFPADGSAGDDGFGFGIAVDELEGEPAWGRSGTHPGGYGAGFSYLPERGVIGVALANVAPSDPDWIARLAAGFARDSAPE